METDYEAPPPQGMTEDEFYAWADEDCPYQYLGGELVREPVSLGHEQIFAFLFGLLRAYLDERGGGEAVGSRYAMRLDPKWSPEPDILFVREERRHLMGPQRLDGRADLVIEIASPGRIDIRKKLPRYHQAELPEIWIVDRYARTVRVDTLTSAGSAGSAGSDGSAGSAGSDASAGSGAYQTRLVSSGVVASAVLPGFWLEVGWLWQEPLPSPLRCLRQILA
ncbi:MAG: Uma2 family endonuclease [Acidobacteria bacterium]|nr:Uma2 family endonuclease [Acidobacteriota bacterium]